MVLADTSVWVEALRNARSGLAERLNELLDQDGVALAAPVRIEILSGASLADQPRLRRVLSALPLWLPEVSTWSLIDTWLPIASKAGERFGFADLLIAATAAERGARLWSLDGDFQRMAKLGFVELFGP